MGKHTKRVWRRIRRRLLGKREEPFDGSTDYWERRYAQGGNSGPGSYGERAESKARVLNEFVRERRIRSVIEFGCGDGNQLALAAYPRYVGLDVSRNAIDRCLDRFAEDDTKSFFLYDSRAFADRHGVFRAELALSLDVIFHLVEDEVFEAYMRHLFAAATRYVVVHSSNAERPGTMAHVRHRPFVGWVEGNCPGWELRQKIENPLRPPSGSQFYIFAPAAGAEAGDQP